MAVKPKNLGIVGATGNASSLRCTPSDNMPKQVGPGFGTLPRLTPMCFDTNMTHRYFRPWYPAASAKFSIISEATEGTFRIRVKTALDEEGAVTEPMDVTTVDDIELADEINSLFAETVVTVSGGPTMADGFTLDFVGSLADALVTIEVDSSSTDAPVVITQLRYGFPSFPVQAFVWPDPETTEPAGEGAENVLMQLCMGGIVHFADIPNTSGFEGEEAAAWLDDLASHLRANARKNGFTIQGLTNVR